ncbi:PIF-4 [Crangon crangon nudivirus]|uniref:PIF-4 n=1 Tax=Crangon crangon nudivirus TaxID=2880838 RepID=A0AAE8Y081_9VIRU|nr:PIF-4 [Crangon crangon nudivirus]UBZ25579.1 PIF-4 [Crangon crangon nudivirus]
MYFSKDDYIILIGSIVLIGIIIIILSTTRTHIFEKTIQKASRNTQFGRTYYEIYDKSSSDICDRLIIVQPFLWYIWAKNGYIMVLGTTNEHCPNNYAPATIIPREVSTEDEYYTFNNVCLHAVMNNIITSYTDHITPCKVKFLITDIQARTSQFTVLDAINDLVKRWITMDSTKSTFLESSALQFLNRPKPFPTQDYIIDTSPKLHNNLLQVLQRHKSLKANTL